MQQPKTKKLMHTPQGGSEFEGAEGGGGQTMQTLYVHEL